MSNDRRKIRTIPLDNLGGNFVLKGYDTERDLQKAIEDIERMLMLISSESLTNIMKFLSKYRAKYASYEEY